ncbi:hypothetical protein GJAV_G00122450 [Gymnothorax javanicus]|nr:hypothetical protein GJAV_G00122450 [Gymnothorax javanicus]
MSAVWRFYELEDECRPAAKCKVCKLMVSRGGSNRASCNTTNLIRHLQKHEAEYKEYSAATESKAGLKQQTLLASLRKDKFPRGGEKARMITQRLTDLIALDDQPISVVENTGFRRLLEFLEPRYELPSRHFITSTAIPQLYNKVRTHVRDLLSDGAAVSFTTVQLLFAIYDLNGVCKTGGIPMSASEAEDYRVKYSVIGSPEQRQVYKNDFIVEYNEYKDLHARIEGITGQFTVLDSQLKQLQRGTDKYKMIHDQILEVYHKIEKTYPNYSQERNRCEYLHNKLAYIKRLVSEYDQQQLKSRC